jgi:predicted metalloprotease with PDZ domain
VIDLAINLAEHRQQLVGVTLRLTPRQPRLLLRLPAWTPGSYLIRDYVRHLEGLELRQHGQRLPLRRLAPATWQAELPALDPLEIQYRLQASELSVRTCHVDADHAFLALAAVVLQVEGERWSPHRLRLALPTGWQPFLSLPGTAAEGWLARDFDQLVDTPVEAGPHTVHRFSVAGVPHRWVGWGDDLPALDPPWLADVARVCERCCQVMGEPTPAARDYLFVLHLLEEGYGGLEHDEGCVLQFGRRALRKPEGRRKLLQLVAHEYLHQWNVRRLRPQPLVPIDYDQPVPVDGLWFAEGITSYLDQLIPFAAGLCSEAELLDDIGADLSRYRLTPGRRVQSLRESAEEAWVKLYRQDGHARNSQVSYYLKGAVLALVLDLHLRRHGSALVRVLRDLWRRYGTCGRGYGQADLVAAFAGHAEDLSTLLPIWLGSTHDPPIDDYLSDVGVRLVEERSEERSTGWLLRRSAAGLIELAGLERGSPAAIAGLQLGDELLAINDQRLRSPEDAVALPPVVSLVICRDGRLRQLTMSTAEPAIRRWRLEACPDAVPDAVERRRSWLNAAA